MKRFFSLLIFLAALAGDAFAQDPQFSQFYAAPLYYNPALAGSSFRDRLVFNYRNQWPQLPGAFVTHAASYDHFFRGYNSGIALAVSTDKAGSGQLRSTNAAALYSYQLELNRNWSARGGLQMGWGFRSMDYYQLTFSDQLNEQGIYLPTEDNSINRHNNINYFDAGLGFLVYSKEFWVGGALHHINRPNQSLIEEEDRLPMRFNVNAGYKILLRDERRYGLRRNLMDGERSVTPTLLYKRQGPFDQLDIGLYTYYSPIVLGLWYRGLPFKGQRVTGIYNHDAVIILAGFKMPNLSFAYSYDLTVSQLGPGIGGAHEISLSYEFEPKIKIKKKYKAIPCPKF